MGSSIDQRVNVTATGGESSFSGLYSVRPHDSRDDEHMSTGAWIADHRLTLSGPLAPAVYRPGTYDTRKHTRLLLVRL